MLKKKSQKQEIELLKKQIQILQAKQEALLIERNFWVDQGRNLQNNLQTWQRMYADLYEQLGRGVVTEQDVKDNLALASEYLRQPLASVEAIAALVASQKPDTQGNYTSIHANSSCLLDMKKG